MTHSQEGVGFQAERDLQADCNEIAFEFIQQYYAVLSQDSSLLYQFYQPQSRLLYAPESDRDARVAIGIEQIKEKAKEIAFPNCKIVLSSLDAQKVSFNGNGILIQVIGEFQGASLVRRFSQSFLLACHEELEGYFIFNDICRYYCYQEQNSITIFKDVPEVQKPALTEKQISAVTADATKVGDAFAAKKESPAESSWSALIANRSSVPMPTCLSKTPEAATLPVSSSCQPEPARQPLRNFKYSIFISEPMSVATSADCKQRSAFIEARFSTPFPATRVYHLESRGTIVEYESEEHAKYYLNENFQYNGIPLQASPYREKGSKRADK